jgi:DNA polymerase-1
LLPAELIGLDLIFDLESDNLLDKVTKLHCITLIDIDTGRKFIGTDHPYLPAEDVILIPLMTALRMLMSARRVIGHNILNYDLPVLRKLYRHDFKLAPGCVVRDTITMARVVWPKDVLREKDFLLWKKERIPGNLIGSYALQAFGYRLREYKGDYDGGWEFFSQEMGDYAVQDVVVTLDLWNRLCKEDWSEESYDLEHDVQSIITRQELHGFRFDRAAAEALIAEIAGVKAELEDLLQAAFPPWVVETKFTPKSNNAKLGYAKGVETVKRKLVVFNPGSRKHIAHVLKVKHGWEPTLFTNDGSAQVDESVLENLPYPEAALLVDYLMVTKRLGQIAEGKEAWFKAVGPDGRMHGRVITNGAVTGRMTHAKPNMAQVPGVKKRKDDTVKYGREGGWGAECRKLFIVGPGKVLVGADAAALELRCLAAFMGDRAYINTVLNGSSKDGTDIHSVNARALGSTRDQAKTWFYAFIYGAGDAKLGSILEAAPGTEVSVGRNSRARFMKNLPALGKLVKLVKNRVEGKAFRKDGKIVFAKTAADRKRIEKEGGRQLPRWLRGMDGRRLHCRSSHSALNTLLQSAGAVLMKKALVILDRKLQAMGYVPGVHYEFCANVHDEWQIEADAAIGEIVGQAAKDSIREAGEFWSFECPLDGDFKVGSSWYATH